jgi:hypothetical protein
MMIRIPIDLHGLSRTQLPLSVFVAFVVGAGLYRVVSTSELSPRRVLPAVLAFVLLATAGPAVVADDLYGLHSGPDLWETRTLPEPQKEFTAAEMAGFQQSSDHIERHDLAVSSDWPSSIGLSRYGADSASFLAENGSLTSDRELLVYRQRWTEYSVRLIPDQAALVTLLVSDGWMDQLVARENKVYTTGQVGILADRADATEFRGGRTNASG